MKLRKIYHYSHPVKDSDITFDQYQSAVGKVISILGDGRAHIIVKVA